jgi:hypothetical protein
MHHAPGCFSAPTTAIGINRAAQLYARGNPWSCWPNAVGPAECSADTPRRLAGHDAEASRDAMAAPTATPAAPPLQLCGDLAHGVSFLGSAAAAFRPGQTASNGSQSTECIARSSALHIPRVFPLSRILADGDSQNSDPAELRGRRKPKPSGFRPALLCRQVVKVADAGQGARGGEDRPKELRCAMFAVTRRISPPRWRVTPLTQSLVASNVALSQPAPPPRVARTGSPSFRLGSPALIEAKWPTWTCPF